MMLKLISDCLIATRMWSLGLSDRYCVSNLSQYTQTVKAGFVVEFVIETIMFFMNLNMPMLEEIITVHFCILCTSWIADTQHVYTIPFSPAPERCYQLIMELYIFSFFFFVKHEA